MRGGSNWDSLREKKKEEKKLRLKGETLMMILLRLKGETLMMMILLRLKGETLMMIF